MFVRQFKSFIYTFCIYKCDKCGDTINPGDPGCYGNGYDIDLCWGCSFINGVITESEFIQYCGVYVNNVHADIIDGEIFVWVGKRKTYEGNNKEARHTPKYETWRKSVYERDNYTCQVCDQVGRKLNAHHIKPFKDFKKLRYDINNGITYCLKCHKEEHGRLKNG